jgi:hypothetical protein
MGNAVNLELVQTIMMQAEALMPTTNIKPDV